MGIRICFEVRFPKYFRELFFQHLDMAAVSFSDVGKEKEKAKINIIRSHLGSRAAENVIYVLSANSISQYQRAPTCIIDPDGNVIDTAPLNEKYLLTAEIEITKPGFARKGRIAYSKALTASYRVVSLEE